MAQKFTSFTPLEEAAPTFTTFTPIEEPVAAEAEKGERTWGEAATDIGAGAVSGLGKLAQFPGQLYGLTTGAIKDKDFATTGMQGVGKEMQDWAKAQKSAELKRRETETQKKVQEAEKTGGQWEAFKTQLYESGTDPMQLGAFLVEQVPASLPSIIAAFNCCTSSDYCGNKTSCTTSTWDSNEGSCQVGSQTRYHGCSGCWCSATRYGCRCRCIQKSVRCVDNQRFFA